MYKKTNNKVLSIYVKVDMVTTARSSFKLVISLYVKTDNAEIYTIQF